MVLYGAQGLTHRVQAQALLERAVQLHWGLEPLPDQARGERGKPYFSQMPRYQFNLSHSGPFALCALSERPVGVDIQVVRPTWSAKLVDRTCTPEERAWLAGLGDRPEDFAKLYGLTKGDYDRLRPYIRIAEEFRLMSDLYPEGVPVRDSIPKRPRQEKFPEGTTVELNAADTVTLKKIPGIGPYYARRIVDYRDRLGGFVSVGQLAEVEDLPEGLERWFTVSPSVSRPLRVNRMSLNALRRHPYLDFYQSKVIVEHRRKYGAIKSLQALSLYEEFAPSDLERLQPYVSFEE